MPKSPALPIVPKARRHKVSELYIAVSGQGSGEEVFTIIGPGDEMIPLVGLDGDARDLLTSYAQAIANESGKMIDIIRFTRRTRCETVRPLSTGD